MATARLKDRERQPNTWRMTCKVFEIEVVRTCGLSTTARARASITMETEARNVAYTNKPFSREGNFDKEKRKKAYYDDD